MNNSYRTRQIISMRQAGTSLQSIGDTYNLSRERIRQILVAECGDSDICPFLSTTELGKLVNLSFEAINRYRRKGIIIPVKANSRLMRYDRNAINTLKKLRACVICGKSLLGRKVRYCSVACYEIAAKESHKRSSWRRFLIKKGQKITPSIAVREVRS